MSEYRCPFCRTASPDVGSTCPTCGAPVDVTLMTTSSGWTQLPPIPDLARIQMGKSSCQVSGSIVPVAEVNLADGDTVFFPHPTLLWQEPAIKIDNLPLHKPWNRMRSGLPLFMLQARGTGKIAFSDDTPGETIVVPIQAGQSIHVREHRMVAATGGLAYDWIDSGLWFTSRGQQNQDQSGAASILKMGMDVAGVAGAGSDRSRDQRDEIEYHYPVGQYLDRFSAVDRPGAVILQVGGNAFVRELADGETILVKPPSLLYADSTVALQMHVEFPHAGMKLWRTWGNRYLWMRLWGPGRVALQSSYDRLEDPGTDFQESCQFTQHIW
jgi:uncharacterized protein (AIM24 family)